MTYIVKREDVSGGNATASRVTILPAASLPGTKVEIWPDRTDTALLLREAIRHLSAVTPALRNEIDLRYGTLTDQPRLKRKIEADLAPVIEAELFLASVEHLSQSTTLTPEPRS